MFGSFKLKGMKVKKRFSTSLIWYHRNEQLPADNKRILVLSDGYDENDPSKVRVINSQFYKTCKDADWWAYVTIPE